MFPTRPTGAQRTVRDPCGGVEELKVIASILAAGYLRYRQQVRRKDSLDVAANPSLHGHEVNAVEKGGNLGDSGSPAD